MSKMLEKNQMRNEMNTLVDDRPHKRSYETTVPILMVDDNWSVDDIFTLEEADDAAIILADSIASINFQLEAPPRDGVRNRLWEARARLALRLKEAALKEVEMKRERLSKAAFQDYAVMRIAKENVDPATFDEWKERAKERFPDLFE